MQSLNKRVSKQERARVVEKVGESHTQFTHMPRHMCLGGTSTQQQRISTSTQDAHTRPQEQIGRHWSTNMDLPLRTAL